MASSVSFFSVYFRNMQLNQPVLLIFLCLAAISSILTHKLTVAAGIVGAVVGWFVFAGAGYWGLAMLGAFFVLGSLATGWKWTSKTEQGMEEHHKGRRNTGQVLANGGVPALLGVLAVAIPGSAANIPLLMAGSISAATADTLSSELGMVYGKRFYQIVSFRKGVKGSNGVISIEGTVFGVAGSLIIGVLYSLGFGNWTALPVILIAGTAGNLTDSLLGALLENKGLLGNNAVNCCCTAVGGLSVWLLTGHHI